MQLQNAFQRVLTSPDQKNPDNLSSAQKEHFQELPFEPHSACWFWISLLVCLLPEPFNGEITEKRVIQREKCNCPSPE